MLILNNNGSQAEETQVMIDGLNTITNQEQSDYTYANMIWYGYYGMPFIDAALGIIVSEEQMYESNGIANDMNISSTFSLLRAMYAPYNKWDIKANPFLRAWKMCKVVPTHKLFFSLLIAVIWCTMRHLYIMLAPKTLTQVDNYKNFANDTQISSIPNTWTNLRVLLKWRRANVKVCVPAIIHFIRIVSKLNLSTQIALQYYKQYTNAYIESDTCICGRHPTSNELSDTTKKAKNRYSKYAAQYGEAKAAISHCQGQYALFDRDGYLQGVATKHLDVPLKEIWVDMLQTNAFDATKCRKEYEGNNVYVIDRLLLMSKICKTHALLLSTWSTRGWTYQESQLAGKLKLVRKETIEELTSIEINELNKLGITICRRDISKPWLVLGLLQREWRAIDSDLVKNLAIGFKEVNYSIEKLCKDFPWAPRLMLALGDRHNQHSIGACWMGGNIGPITKADLIINENFAVTPMGLQVEITGATVFGVDIGNVIYFGNRWYRLHLSRTGIYTLDGKEVMHKEAAEMLIVANQNLVTFTPRTVIIGFDNAKSLQI